MARFAATDGEREGERLIVLTDAQSGAEARLWPGCGNKLAKNVN